MGNFLETISGLPIPAPKQPFRMREFPLLFRGEMVLATRQDRKFQTRRTRGLEEMNAYAGRIEGDSPRGPLGYRGVMPSNCYLHKDLRADYARNPSRYHCFLGINKPGPLATRLKTDVDTIPVRCPYGGVGDLMWVRETWLEMAPEHGPDRYAYRADCDPESERCRLEYIASGFDYQWRSSLHMPRKASRILLRITSLRIERVQCLTVEDAIAEGLKPLSKDGGQTIKYGIPDRDGLPGNDDYGWHWSEWETDPRCAYRKLWQVINGKTVGYRWDDNPLVWVIGYEVM